MKELSIEESQLIIGGRCDTDAMLYYSGMQLFYIGTGNFTLAACI